MTKKRFRGIFERRVGRFLHSDITKWWIPSILLRAFAGLWLSGLVLAVMVPLFGRNGAHVNQPFAWLVMAGCVMLCVGPDMRRLLRRQATKPGL